jgi:hypothetical protein
MDVSFLFPLPSALGERTSLIAADESGPLGELLPQDIYLALPLVDAALTNLKSYPLLRVISIRLDPCFPGLGEPCQHQIRLVMQPVTIAVTGDVLVANDAAVHLFYVLEEDAWLAALREIVRARVRAGVSEPGVLGVHPALAAEGLNGDFMATVRWVLRHAAGRENLTRVTFMALEAAGVRWRFGGVDVTKEGLVPVPIAGLVSGEQTFVNQDVDGMTFEDAAVSPPSPSPDAFEIFLHPELLAATTEAERAALYGAILRVEHPEKHSPATVDCVTCHLTAPVKTWVERTYGLTPSTADLYPTDGLQGATSAATNHVRAFGYFATSPAISQRTVNETAAVVAYVNATYR